VRRTGAKIIGSVATLQVARDRLAGCSSWPLRFAVYSSGANLSRRSSCWQWGGTCAFPFRTATRGVARRAGFARRSRHGMAMGTALRPRDGTTFALEAQTDQRQLAGRRLTPAGSIAPGFSRATVMMHFPILRCVRHLRTKYNNTL
jgi:hypothetical protein